jgi:lactate permease
MFPVTYQQPLDPLNNRLLSTLFAGLPVLVLFWLLVPLRWKAHKAALAGAIAAVGVAWLVYQMPLIMAAMAFVHGAAFGLLPVGWTIFNTMLLYNITVETGHFAAVRRSVAGLSADARIQAILIGFAFGAFLEGAAGAGTPVAICGAIMVGLGFDPFLAAVLCLIANTSPVAFGGLGTPLLVLGDVTGLPPETLSVMAGRQLPLLSCIIPIYMTRCMCTWKQTLEVWPALAVAGLSFAGFQYTFATIHYYVPGVVLFPMTDIGGGIFALLMTAVLLRFWRPRHERHFFQEPGSLPTSARPSSEVQTSPAPPSQNHLIEVCSKPKAVGLAGDEQALSLGQVIKAWAPYALMSLFLFLTGLVRQQEQGGRAIWIGPIKTKYSLPIYSLHHATYRDPRVIEESRRDKPERAEFDIPWLTAPGSPVFAAALVSIFMFRMSRAQVRRVIGRTIAQMRIPIPAIACMLGLSYVTRYGGLDATLGIAFAASGFLYPFFAAILGWLGVFLTGTDAGSNALFGSLQKITASQIYQPPIQAFQHLDLGQAQVLICTANSTGGVMGKMIDAQSICVATAATHQIGREADIFKAVIWHSIVLAGIVGLITLVQAYLPPFTQLVPRP